MEISREEIIELYDYYGQLLTEKQKTYFEEYYFYDLSFAEIAENYDVSRNAVFDQNKRTVDALINYEKILKLREKMLRIEQLNIDEKIKNQIINIMNGEK